MLNAPLLIIYPNKIKKLTLPKIMDTLFLLMLPILGVIMYFVMVRKNAFEERLALYRPQH